MEFLPSSTRDRRTWQRNLYEISSLMLAYMTPESTQFILLYLTSAVNKHIDWRGWEEQNISQDFKGQLFKWSLAIIQQNRVLSHFQFVKRFNVNPIYRKQFH